MIKGKYYNYLKTFDDFSNAKEKSKILLRYFFNMWTKAENFTKIINFRQSPIKGEKLEEEIEIKLTTNGWAVFRNVVLANKDLTFKKEIDIYAIKEGKELIIECTTTRAAVKWNIIAELLGDIKENLGCNTIFVSTKITDFGKKVLKTKGVLGVNINELQRYIE